MNNEEAARDRGRITQSDRERSARERQTSPEERASEERIRNADKKQEREVAKEIIRSESPSLKEIAKQGGSLGRKIEREIRRFEQTGRVSNWLAGQTIKAEAAQNAAQQSAFRQAVTDVITTSPSGFLELSPNSPSISLSTRKPEVLPEPVEGGEGCVGLNLYTKDDEVWIGAGTVAGLLPSGFDPLEGKEIASSGSGNVWAQININQENGNITSVSVSSGSTTPEDTDSAFYYTLGFYSYGESGPSFANFGCGSINASVCRNWFVAEPPFFSISFSR
jgi:hypothetical protein